MSQPFFLHILGIDKISVSGGYRYLTVTLDLESGAVRVLGHFHVVKLMNDELSSLRGELQRQAEDQQIRELCTDLLADF